jgi:hypothetical protein
MVMNLVCKLGEKKKKKKGAEILCTFRYMHTYIYTYVTILAEFGTRIKQRIYGQCTDGRAVFSFANGCKNNLYI